MISVNFLGDIIVLQKQPNEYSSMELFALQDDYVLAKFKCLAAASGASLTVKCPVAVDELAAVSASAKGKQHVVLTNQ